MPNHCENTLTVTGPADDLTVFKQTAKTGDQPLDLSNFIPMPDALKNDDPSPNAQRDWALRHWGTKWGAYEGESVDVNDNTVEYIFLTAWSPINHEALQRISAKHPTLTFSIDYEEPGMAFKGHTAAQAGNITTHWSREMTEEDITALTG